MPTATPVSVRDRDVAAVSIAPEVLALPAVPAQPAVPARRSMPHYPGLDGLRGLAVVGVLLFHGGFGWARGGFLGVSTFFTLSGFLITGLLLAERGATGRIDLRRFWARRVRRLLPALLVAVVVGTAYGAFVGDADQLSRLRHDGLATLGYVANWRFIFSGQAYSDLFGAPSPLLHMWSLAIEEQFYLLFPLLVAGVMWNAKRPLAALGVVLAVLAGASVVAAIFLADRSGIDRAYYGTDTRAVELLAGALLAVGIHRLDFTVARARRRKSSVAVAAAGVVAMAVTFVAWSTAHHDGGWLYRGGFAAYAVVTSVVVLAAISPGPVRTLLSLRLLRCVGAISYGLYLYHWPVFLWLSPERTALDPVRLLAVRLAVTFALALVSYHLLELPIRRGRLSRATALVVTPAAATVTAALLLWASVAPPLPTFLAAAPAGHVEVTAEPALTLRSASSIDPLRVLISGDSVAFDAESGIAAALEGTGQATVHRGAMVGFGLTRSSNWESTWTEMLASSRAEVAVLMFGTWDTDYIEDRGVEAYVQVVDRALTLFESNGVKVLVIGMPMSETRRGQSLPRPADAVFRDLPDRWPGVVAYLDTDPVLSPGGRYTEYLAGPDGERERVRKLDGTHLCPAGAARLGDAVVAILGAGGALDAPDPEWRAGEWALGDRYHEPPGACSA
jgi:peptidoglycan/LPS O-acetylase OafA/YrhL